MNRAPPPEDAEFPESRSANDPGALFESLLIACDEAIHRGEALPRVALEAPPEFQPRLWEAVECLRALFEARKDESTLLPSQVGPGELPALEVNPRQRVGRFQLLRELGRGGHGVVFLAIDPRLGRLTALKLPRPEVLITPELHRRFLREAKAASALAHPNLVPIYEAGDDGPLCYIAAAYCAGPTLAHWLKQQRTLLPFREAAALVAALSEGVAHAHARGIVHRDIKPGNILLTPASAASPGVTSLAGEFVAPCLTDFGLARLSDGDGSDITRAGAMLGTPSYMAPEQADGRTQQIGPATDVYALGATLYELLVGRAPFRGANDLETLRLVSAGKLVPPAAFRPDMPRDLGAICLHAMASHPDDRYHDAAALVGDLRRFLNGEATLARPLGPLGRTTRWIRQRPLWAALAAVCLAALLTITGGGWWYSVRLAAALEEARQARQRSDDLLDAAELRSAWEAYNGDNAQEAKTILERMERELARGRGAEKHRSFAWRVLQKLTQQDPLTLRGHLGDVYSVTWSPDGRRLASAGRDGAVRFWDAATGASLAALAAHDGEVNAAAWSPDGRRVASAGDDGAVRWWNALTLQSCEPVWRLEHGPVVSLAFAPDGAWLASGDNEGRIAVHDSSTGASVKTVETGGGRVHGLAVSRDGLWLASATDERGVELWNLAHSQPPQRAPAMENRAQSVLFNRRGELLSCGLKWAYVWDFQRNEAPRRISRSHDFIYSLVLCSDERLAALASKDEMLRVFDVATGELRATLIGHADRIWSVAASPDGRRLASASADGSIKIWRVLGSQAEWIVDCPASQNGVAFSPDGQSLLAAGAEGILIRRRLRRAGSQDGFPWELSEAILFSRRSGAMAPTTADDPPPPPGLTRLAVSPSGDLAATVRSKKQGVELWDLQTGKSAGELLDAAEPTDPAGLESSAVAFSADGRTLAEAMQRSLRLWDLKSRTVVRRIGPAPEDITALALSPDGRRLAVAAGEFIELRNLAGELVTRWEAHRSRINALAFSRAGLLASASQDRLVKLWDGADGRALASFHGHTERIEALAFSPDARLLASGAIDRHIKIWNLRTREEIATLRSFPGGVLSLAFHPTRMMLAAAGDAPDSRGQIRLWSAEADDRWQPLDAADASDGPAGDARSWRVSPAD